MQDLLGQPLFFIYLIYGVSFLAMAYLISRGIMRSTSVALVSTFYMLAIFGMTHGLAEMIDWMRFVLRTLGTEDVDVLIYMSQGFMIISFVFLLQFGANLMTYRWEKKGGIRSIPFLLFILYIAVILYLRIDDVLKAGLIGRYAFGFAGSAFTAITLFNLSRTLKPLGNPKLVRGLIVGATGFAFYAVFGGLIVTPLMGFPIQLFRAACALVIAVSFLFVLDVFKYEH